MSVIRRTRTIRPLTHDESDPYRIHCDKVLRGDTLEIQIKHKSDSNVDMLFQIRYDELRGKNSIHFKFQKNHIDWLDGIQPQRIR